MCRYQGFKKRFSRFIKKRPKLAQKSRKLLFVTKGNVDVLTKLNKNIFFVAEICKLHHQVRFLRIFVQSCGVNECGSSSANLNFLAKKRLP